MTVEIQNLRPLPRPPLRKRIWRDSAFLVQATFWYIFIRPFEQIQQRLNEMCKAIDEYRLRQGSTAKHETETQEAGIAQKITPEQSPPERTEV